MESANKMKLTYTNVNGYLIPNLTYKSGEQMEQLGKYGFLRRDYSQKIDLCLNEGDEVVDCDLIIICEHEIAVGGMRNISRPDGDCCYRYLLGIQA